MNRRRTSSWIFLAGFLSIASLASAADAIWQVAREGMPGLSGAAFGASTYVVVSGTVPDEFESSGTPGEIWTSPDTVHWTRQHNPDPAHRPFTDLAFGGGRFAAVGLTYNGSGPQSVVLSSADGYTWSMHGTVGREVWGVAADSDAFVAVGAAGAIYASPDAATWHPVAPVTPGTLYGVAYGDGQFLAIGTHDVSHHTELAASPTGETWTLTPGISGDYRFSITYGRGAFLAAGPDGIARSTDGVTWQQVQAGYFTKVVATRAQFLAFSHGVMLASPDGIEWSTVHLSVPPGVSTRRLAAATSGPLGSIVGAIGGALYASSADTPTHWINQTLEGSRSLTHVAASSAGYCAIGAYGAISASPDGVSWINNTPQAMGQRPSPSDVTYGDGLYVATGNNVIRSADCLHWSEAPLPGAVREYFARAVGHGDGVFIAGGDHWVTPELPVPALLRSSDGQHWDPVEAGIPNNYGFIWTIGWGAGRWIAVGRQGQLPQNGSPTTLLLLTSDDGFSWTKQLNPGPFAQGEFIESIAWHGDVFAGTSTDLINHCRIWTSPDGGTWTLRSDHPGLTCGEIGSGPAGFVVPTSAGALLRSPDGIAWTIEPSGTEKALWAAAYSKTQGRWVVVGESVIIREP
jgi:hypothetical protein